MELTNSTAKCFYGIEQNTHVGFEMYHIGKWTIKEHCIYFEGFGISNDGLCIRPMIGQRCSQIDKLKQIAEYEYTGLVEKLNCLFDNIQKWLRLLPCSEGLVEDNLECNTPGVLYTNHTIYISKEFRWDYNGNLMGSYGGSFHMSYYDSDHQSSYYFEKERDYIEFPAVNDFYSFTDLSLKILYRDSTLKKLSQDSYSLLKNAIENESHKIFSRTKQYFIYGKLLQEKEINELNLIINPNSDHHTPQTSNSGMYNILTGQIVKPKDGTYYIDDFLP